MTTAWGHGLATIAADGTVLDTWFPAPALGEPPAQVEAPAEVLDGRTEAVLVEIDTDAAPASTPDAYLRLHLLSHLLVAPNGLNLDGVFGHLPNVAWTTAGPVHPDDFARLRPTLQRAGISALGLDKFPRLIDYVVPER